MVVGTGGSIVRVGSITGICHWSLTLLLQTSIGEGFTKTMLAIPYLGGDTVLEANHVVFPVLHKVLSILVRRHFFSFTHTNVIIHVLSQKDTSPVIGIEVHVKCINSAIATIVDNDRKACSSISLASTIRLHSIEPCWMCSDVVIGREVDAFTSLRIQRIKVVQSQRSRVSIDNGEVDFWLSMFKLGCDVTGEICFARI